MSQFDFGTIDPNVKTGTQLAADLNSWRDAIHTTHAGVARPAYVKPGMLWVEQVSAALWRLRMAGNTGDAIVGQIDPVANAYTVLHADGTLAAPGITFANETGLGWYRAGAGVLAAAVGGVAPVAIRANQFALGAGVAFAMQGQIQAGQGTELLPPISFSADPSTGIWRAAANDLRFVVGGVGRMFINPSVGIGATLVISAPAFTANGTFLGAGTPANQCSLCSPGPIWRGAAGANNFGKIQLSTTDGTGAVGSPYQWTANAGTAVGFHELGSLAGNGALRVFGGAVGTGAGGASLMAMYTGAAMAGMDMVVTNGTPGSQASEIRFSVMRNGALVTAGDLVLKMNSVFKAQLLLKGGWGTDLTNIFSAPVVVQSDVSGLGQYPGITMSEGNGNGFVWESAANAAYWGGQGGGGPLSGWAMNLNAFGSASAAAFTPTSDASLKSHVRPIVDALASILKLRGVRYRRAFGDKGESLGLIAQEVVPVYPELVGETKGPLEDDPPVKTLDYMALIGPIIEALREINGRVVALEGGPK